MQFTMSASGSPTAVRESINQQAKALVRGASAGWPVAAAVRDYVAQQVDGLPSDRSVSVSVSVTVALTGAEREASAGRVTAAGLGTVGVEGKAVAIVGEDRVVATDPTLMPGEPAVGGPDVPLPAITGDEPYVAGISDAGAGPTGRRATDRPGSSK